MASTYDDKTYDRIEQITRWATDPEVECPQWLAKEIPDCADADDRVFWAGEALDMLLVADRGLSNMTPACEDACDAIRAGCTLREWTFEPDAEDDQGDDGHDFDERAHYLCMLAWWGLWLALPHALAMIGGAA